MISLIGLSHVATLSPNGRRKPNRVWSFVSGWSGFIFLCAFVSLPSVSKVIWCWAVLEVAFRSPGKDSDLQNVFIEDIGF